MTESKTESIPSLLPYLDATAGGIYFDIRTLAVPAKGRTSVAATIESSGPFAAVFEGVVASGDAGGLADLFFLVQPDHYPLVPSELNPINNIQVEQLWQSAFERIRGRHAAVVQPVLAEQIDVNGYLLPWRPLFYCAHRNRWCHPHCPHCGDSLTLCRDDRLLLDSDLLAYSQSLARYLYCPVCAAKPEGSFFYAPALPSQSPEKLNDCVKLLEGFSGLLSKKNVADDLPCIGCAEATNCYGPKTLVHERMSAVFFYPFFMFLMPAPTVNLLEFSALLSGEKREEMLKRLGQQSKPGRAERLKKAGQGIFTQKSLIFEQDDRHFLEVLYLKLALLGELFSLIPQDKEQLPEPVAGMSLESIWVDLPLQGAHLPSFWNFSLRLIDPVGQPDNTFPGSIPPLGRRLHFLGAAWYYILLAGAGQSMEVVRAAINKLIQHGKALEPAADIDLEEIDPAFNARHLLADGGAAHIDPQWATLWRRVLLMGAELLNAGLHPEQIWSEESFQLKLNALQKQVRQSLFQTPAAAPSDERSDAIDSNADVAIATILKSMLRKWPPMEESAKEKESLSTKTLITETWVPSDQNDDSDMVETVILGKEDDLDTQPAATEVPPDLEETVLIRSVKKPSDLRKAPSSLESTMVIQPASGRSDSTSWSEDLDKTVVIPVPGDIDRREDQLEQTVVLGSTPVKGRRVPGAKEAKQAKEPASDGDDLEKTVIIQPKQAKDRKPKP